MVGAPDVRKGKSEVVLELHEVCIDVCDSYVPTGNIPSQGDIGNTPGAKSNRSMIARPRIDLMLVIGSVIWARSTIHTLLHASCMILRARADQQQPRQLRALEDKVDRPLALEDGAAPASKRDHPSSDDDQEPHEHDMTFVTRAANRLCATLLHHSRYCNYPITHVSFAHDMVGISTNRGD